MMDLWLRMLCAALATWRVAHMLVYEEGPGMVFVRLRVAAGVYPPNASEEEMSHWPGPTTFLGGLLSCFNCTSVWVAVPLTVIAVLPGLWWCLYVPFAVSAAAIVAQELIDKE